MRPIFIPLAGATDANGNATIQVPLERTGDWRNVKFALGTTGPAEWAVLKTGTALTYGRGRRVTLGPELLEPQDTVSVSVSGAPVNAAISGSVSGLGGTMSEIMATFSPAPNTIALDSANPRQQLFPAGGPGPTTGTGIPTSFQVASGGLSGAKVFSIPTGTAALRIMVTAGGLFFAYNLLVVGSQSVEQYFGNPTAPGSSIAVPTPTLPFTVPIERDWDSQIEIHVEQPTQNVNVFVSALFAPEAPGQAGTAQSVVIPTPAFWQAPTTSTYIELATVSGTSHAIPATAGRTIYLFAVELGTDVAAAGGVIYKLADTSGFLVGGGRSASIVNNGDFINVNFMGRPMILGAGLDVVFVAGTAANVRGTIAYALG